MSEFFTGVTFPQQKVTPSDDAVIRKTVLTDCILSGCALSYVGSTLTMGAGMILGCGRQFRHTSVQNWAVTGATSGYARLVLTLEMSKASTKNAFEQVVDSIGYAGSLDGFLPLQQNDINEAGTIYQMAVCVVSLGAGGSTGIVSRLDLHPGFRPGNWLPTPEEIGAEPAGATRTKRVWENASPGSSFSPQTIPLELAEGDWIEITYKAATNGTVHTTERVRVGENILLIAYANATSSSPVSIYARRANTTAAGVEFEKGTSKVITDGDTFGNDNAKVIPLYIHVIKGVQK